MKYLVLLLLVGCCYTQQPTVKEAVYTNVISIEYLGDGVWVLTFEGGRTVVLKDGVEQEAF